MTGLSKMHEYQCDGMPTMTGCPGTIEVSRPWVREGTKKSGWLVTCAMNDDGVTPDHSYPLYFCPSCAEVVLKQEAARLTP